MKTFRQKRTESLLSDDDPYSSSQQTRQVLQNTDTVIKELYKDVKVDPVINASSPKQDGQTQHKHQSLITQMHQYLLYKCVQDLRTRQPKEVKTVSPKEDVDTSMIVAALRDKSYKRTA